VSETVAPPPRSTTEGSLEQQLNQLVQAEADTSANAFLLVVEGPQAGRLHVVPNGVITIGRGTNVDLKLNDPSASQAHARIEARDGIYRLEDLNSRNGTRVNGETVRSMVLHHKDAIVIGGTSLVFLCNAQDHQVETNVLPAPPKNAIVPVSSPPRYGLARADNSAGLATAHVSFPAPFPLAEPEEENGIVSLIRTATVVLRLIKRYAWILLPLPIVASLVGVSSFYWLPGTERAEATIRLLHHEKGTAPAQPWEKREEVFFTDPIVNFRQRPLINKTLQSLGVTPSQDLTEVMVALITVEATSPDTYAVAYFQNARDATFSALALLTKHLDTYVVSEIDKAITSLSSEATFLGDRYNRVTKELEAARAEHLAYAKTHVGTLPEETEGLLDSQSQLTANKLDLETETQELSARLKTIRAQIAKGRHAFIQTADQLQPLKSQLTQKKVELQSLKAANLTDQHPDVVKVRKEIERLEAEIAKEREKPVDPEDDRVQTLKQEEQRIADELTVKQSALGRVMGNLGGIGEKLKVGPEVASKLEALSARVKSLATEQETLNTQYRERLKQIDLEKAYIASRYQVIDPPKLVNTRTSKYVMMRLGIGFGLGLVLALLIAGYFELKLFIKRHPELQNG
jgi:pSer/pThr/pTyr-binding forkhead associated (FHA) protein/uncharacterized protein involved in exopolysaccharide biosynthesis